MLGTASARFACGFGTLLLGIGLVAARPADAASVSSITYDITAGDFGSIWPNLWNGTIDGVSVTYTPPGGGPVATPFSCKALYACGRLNFLATGKTHHYTLDRRRIPSPTPWGRV